MQENTQHSILASLILSETSGGDTKPNNTQSRKEHQICYDTTLTAEREEELKSLLMKGKEESEKVGLKLNVQNTNTIASGPITSWQIDGETMEIVIEYFWELQNHCRW